MILRAGSPEEGSADTIGENEVVVVHQRPVVQFDAPVVGVNAGRQPVIERRVRLSSQRISTLHGTTAAGASLG